MRKNCVIVMIDDVGLVLLGKQSQLDGVSTVCVSTMVQPIPTNVSSKGRLTFSSVASYPLRNVHLVNCGCCSRDIDWMIDGLSSIVLAHEIIHRW